VIGYTIRQHERMLSAVGLEPIDSGSYSKFFTEMIELAINFGYVRMLAKKRGGAQPGHIAPVSSGELKTHGAAYKLYSLIYPLAWAVSKLDVFLPRRTDNAVIVTAVKEAAS
jgi:hypothetical protein